MNIDLGNRIKKLRVKKNISQQQLADIINVSQATIHLWERNDACFKINYLIKIAQVLDVKLEELLHTDERIYADNKEDLNFIDISEYEKLHDDFLKKSSCFIKTLIEENSLLKKKILFLEVKLGIV